MKGFQPKPNLTQAEEEELLGKFIDARAGDESAMADLANLAGKAKTKDYTDSLTGVNNRGYLDELLEYACGNSKLKAGLIFLDLDKFKIINDTEGHAAGDEVLKLLANTIKENLPRGWNIARAGGDEFAIVAASENRYSLEEEIKKWQIKIKSKLIEVGIQSSTGYAIKNDSDTPGAWLKRADESMYVDKRSKKIITDDELPPNDRRSRPR